MVSFWQRYDTISAEAKASEVGKVMTAAGYNTAHTGGGCMCWERILDDGRYFWICDEENGLGGSVNEAYLVGFYAADGNDLEYDTINNLKDAVGWCAMAKDRAKDAESDLCKEYDQWLIAQRLPKMSADELICEDVTAEQSAWLSEFSKRWENVMARQ